MFAKLLTILFSKLLQAFEKAANGSKLTHSVSMLLEIYVGSREERLCKALNSFVPKLIQVW